MRFCDRSNRREDRNDSDLGYPFLVRGQCIQYIGEAPVKQVSRNKPDQGSLGGLVDNSISRLCRIFPSIWKIA